MHFTEKCLLYSKGIFIVVITSYFCIYIYTLLCQTQALAEKQSAYYSAQRQLKACRQNLEHKELYVNLLQKKTASLEERVNTLSQHQTQAAGDRVGWSVITALMYTQLLCSVIELLSSLVYIL